jgi:hypothetical protein
VAGVVIDWFCRAIEEDAMRVILAVMLVAATTGLAAADDKTANPVTPVLQSPDPQSVPQQSPVDSTAVEPLFYGFSGDCHHGSASKSDTAKLLMN